MTDSTTGCAIRHECESSRQSASFQPDRDQTGFTLPASWRHTVSLQHTRVAADHGSTRKTTSWANDTSDGEPEDNSGHRLRLRKKTTTNLAPTIEVLKVAGSTTIATGPVGPRKGWIKNPRLSGYRAGTRGCESFWSIPWETKCPRADEFDRTGKDSLH